LNFIVEEVKNILVNVIQGEISGMTSAVVQAVGLRLRGEVVVAVVDAVRLELSGIEHRLERLEYRDRDRDNAIDYLSGQSRERGINQLDPIVIPALSPPVRGSGGNP